MTLAQDITKRFNGDWHGDYGTFPTPGHGPKDRGMSVKDDSGAPDGVLGRRLITRCTRDVRK